MPRLLSPRLTRCRRLPPPPTAHHLPLARRPLQRPATVCQGAAAPVQEVLEAGSQGFNGEIPKGLNKYSGQITQPKSQGASQAMLYATGLTEADMSKPQVQAGVGPERAARHFELPGHGRRFAVGWCDWVRRSMRCCIRLCAPCHPRCTRPPTRRSASAACGGRATPATCT